MSYLDRRSPAITHLHLRTTPARPASSRSPARFRSPLQSYYAAKTRPPSPRSISDSTLADVINRVHPAHFCLYAYPQRLASPSAAWASTSGATTSPASCADVGLLGVTRTKRIRTTLPAIFLLAPSLSRRAGVRCTCSQPAVCRQRDLRPRHRVTDALSHTTTYAYDVVSNLVTRTDANGHVTTYAFDAARRLTSVSDPLSRVTSFTYDAAGNLATATDATGQTTTYTYDALDRVTAIDYADPATPDVTFAYDANGNRTAMSDGAGTETASYDALDRLTGLTRGSSSFSYAYDAAGNVTSRTYPDGTVVGYAYDVDGRLASVTAGSATTTSRYDPASQLTATALPNGVTETRTYDAAGRLTTIAAASPTTPLTSLAYTYDPAGNVSAVATDAGSAADTTRASTASDGTQGDAASNQAAVSADGRWVAFTSAADNLVAGDTNGATDIFVHDRLTGTTERVSVSSSGAQADGASELPTISADGRFVAFRSLADNLVSGDTNATWDIFVHDRATGVTQRVSVSSTGGQGQRHQPRPGAVGRRPLRGLRLDQRQPGGRRHQRRPGHLRPRPPDRHHLARVSRFLGERGRRRQLQPFAVGRRPAPCLRLRCQQPGARRHERRPRRVRPRPGGGHHQPPLGRFGGDPGQRRQLAGPDQRRRIAGRLHRWASNLVAGDTQRAQ